MKIRLGFVSNSSSSSFCIYGAELNDEREELLKKFNKEDKYDLIDAIENQSGLYVSTGPDGDYLYIGRSWDSIKDDETGSDFKGDVQRKLNDLIGKEIECSTCSEAWHD